MSIEIAVNGETQRLAPGATIADLLAELAIAPRNVGVERNLAIVPKSAYGTTELAAGDRIEIVQFVGGG